MVAWVVNFRHHLIRSTQRQRLSRPTSHLHPLSISSSPSTFNSQPLQRSNVQTFKRVQMFSTIPFLFIFLRTLLHIFALTKNTTPLFSIVSTLCVKKHNRRRRVRVESPSLKPSLKKFG